MRKGRPKKRIILPDPKYKDRLVTQFVNNLMFSGKKSIAFSIFYDAMDIGRREGERRRTNLRLMSGNRH